MKRNKYSQGPPSLAYSGTSEAGAEDRRILSEFSSLVPSSSFQLHCSLHYPSSGMLHHRHSFSVDVVDKWNAIPDEVVQRRGNIAHVLHLPPLSGTPLLFLALCESRESREPSHKQKKICGVCVCVCVRACLCMHVLK